MIKVSDFIDSKYKEFAYYVLQQRAIPSLKDGLKPVQRRILYTAKSYAINSTKVVNLAGTCLKIHPHGDAAVSAAIGNMAQDFCGSNNHPFFDGEGGFGGKIMGSGNGIASPRYVSVKLNKFTREVMFKDYDLVKEIPNYDGEYTEVENFLPLIPIVLLNGTQGIAVGFACEIQPYNIKDIIELQKNILKKKKDFGILSKLTPFYRGFNGKIYWDNELNKFKTTGIFHREKDYLRITELPIGCTRESYLKVLDALLEKDKIKDFVDNSKEEFDFTIYFKTRKLLTELSDSDILNMFKLTSTLSENLTILDTNNKLKVYEQIFDIIEEFTQWRFSFFKKRYELYKEKLSKENDIKKELLRFIIYVLKNDLLKTMSNQNQKDTKKILEDLKFINVDYLLSIGVSNFNKDKIVTLKEQIETNNKKIEEYTEIIESEVKQKEIYLKELDETLKGVKE